jgi:hypothetical protein
VKVKEENTYFSSFTLCSFPLNQTLLLPHPFSSAIVRDDDGSSHPKSQIILKVM